MKKTSLKHLIRTVKKNAVSFFAVAFIAAISIAIYIGLQSAANATLKASDSYFGSSNLASFEVYSKNGITEEDIRSLESLENISAVEGGYSTAVSAVFADGTTFINGIALSEKMNLPVVLEGKLPTEAYEVAVERRLAEENGIDVGDRITLTDKSLLKGDTFEVTAVVNRPEYCCAKVNDVRGSTDVGFGSLSYFMCFTEDAFNTDALGGRFTKAYVRSDVLDEAYYYSEEYSEKEEALLEEIKAALGGEDYTVAIRDDMGDLRAMRILVDSIFGLSYVMSIIFVIVAVIVCYAAVSRMTYEHRGLIGAQKALGFTVGEVLRHFMLYNLLCAALGILLGIALGVLVVENIVIYIFAGEFLLPPIPMLFPGVNIAIAATVCIVIFTATSYFAASGLLRKPATVLLKHEVKSRKKPFFFESMASYKKLRLYTRSMIKNVLNDKERMITTVMGVVGCIALLIICFSLKLGIENSSVRQFEDYFLYENRLVIDSTLGNPESFEFELEEMTVDYIKVSDKLRGFYVDKSVMESGHIVVADSLSELQDFMVTKAIDGGEAVTDEAEGVYVSRKCAEVYDLSRGSRIMLSDSHGEYHSASVAGVIEHYLPYHMFVTTSDYYETLTGESADRCVYLIKGDVTGLKGVVSKLDGFISLRDNSDSEAKADQINMVIGLCLALAAAMSVLVLLNQITMHISRCSKELAVMRVNGYSVKETKLYVCKDNIVLTAVGLFLGSVFGAVLSYISVRIMEGEINRYVRDVNPIACAIGIIVGAVFAVFVNIIALKKVDKLSLTDIQKD